MDCLHSTEKPLLALEALCKLSEQFANKPEFHQLVHTMLLTLSGQFSVGRAFAVLRKPGLSDVETIFLATGKFSGNVSLKTLIFTTDFERYLLEHKSPCLVSDLDLGDSCSSYTGIFNDNGVELIGPLVHNDSLLGIFGLGEKVTRKPFDQEDIELFGSLLNTLTPLVASSYEFWEVTRLSAWYLDILNHVKQGVYAFGCDNRLKKINTAGFNIIRLHNPQVSHPVAMYNGLIEEVFPEDIFNDWARRFIKAVAENNSQSIEDLVAEKNDDEYAYDAYVTKISADLDSPSDFIVTLDDVTERRREEKQKKQLQEKLERAERMESLGILAGGVAHDLNNMLGPVVGYAEMILRDTPEDSKIGQRVKKIGRSAQEAANVVQDLLTLARRGRYEMIPISLNEIIESYLDSPSFLKLAQLHPDVKVELKLDKAIANINGSSSHLSKVIMNLVINAFDAMPAGGKLIIETSQQYLEKLLGGHQKVEYRDYILLRVRDTGVGIEPNDLARIFEPYYSKKKMGASGSGLGLSVVYGVVKDHKGYYDILSTIGKGTEFILYFPVSNVEVQEQHEDEANIEGDETVLLVDDVQGQREMASELISDLGYDVTTAANGRKAVEYLKTKSVDIVVLDMIMEPDFDGLDTYREIVKMHLGQRAVIVSGFSATDRVVEAQRLGAGGYIKKPFTCNAIGKAIREELDKKPLATS